MVLSQRVAKQKPSIAGPSGWNHWIGRLEEQLRVDHTARGLLINANVAAAIGGKCDAVSFRGPNRRGCRSAIGCEPHPAATSKFKYPEIAAARLAVDALGSYPFAVRGQRHGAVHA